MGETLYFFLFLQGSGLRCYTEQKQLFYVETLWQNKDGKREEFGIALARERHRECPSRW